MNKKATILYVDSEVNNQSAFTAIFRKDYRILLASSAEEGFQVLRDNDVQIIVSDHHIANVAGIKFLEETLISHSQCARILVTDYPGIYVDNTAKIYGYISKPWDEKQLHVLFKSASDLYFLLEMLKAAFW
ncbi:response regulator [Dyadobacter sp. 3J3]|uniref:response regulator n=1 Tax=Dyadobacter sp. 3J3 TaxID=2606600 RepID=UPI0013571696|nr:response regulator [Dyadobacter sp. 3J3]